MKRTAPGQSLAVHQCSISISCYSSRFCCHGCYRCWHRPGSQRPPPHTSQPSRTTLPPRALGPWEQQAVNFLHLLIKPAFLRAPSPGWQGCQQDGCHIHLVDDFHPDVVGGEEKGGERCPSPGLTVAHEPPRATQSPPGDICKCFLQLSIH